MSKKPMTLERATGIRKWSAQTIADVFTRTAESDEVKSGDTRVVSFLAMVHSVMTAEAGCLKTETLLQDAINHLTRGRELMGALAIERGIDENQQWLVAMTHLADAQLLILEWCDTP